MSLRGSKRGALGVCAFMAVELLTACPRDNGQPVRDAGAPDAEAYSGDGGAQCSKSSEVLQVQHIDKLDILFVIDNSNSMHSEQRALLTQMPKLIQALTSGYRREDDPEPFAPIQDIHVGVVSSDMGIPGIEYPPYCAADGGDDGKLQHTARGESCDAQYPSWLSFSPGSDPLQFADDIGCIAALGTGGCGFEQQLDAPLKALTPRLLTDASGNLIPNSYRFLASDDSRTWGLGDMAAAHGGNAGFLRSSVTQGPSLVAIVVLTDEEDCSVHKTEHLAPRSTLPEDSPYRDEEVNLRCFLHKDALYDLEQRYLQGFRALRPGREELVLYAAIAGVPANLISADVDLDNAAAREQLYNTILSDPRMQESIDPTKPLGEGNLIPSCSRTVAGESAPATAFPPRRLVELARLFGANGLVQSICQDDFTPVAEALVARIAKRLGEPCLQTAISRHGDGLVSCDVIWELPPVAVPGAPTPTACAQLPFLNAVDQGSAQTNAAGGANCKVKQLAVTDTSTKIAPPGDGWFYDDYTDERSRTCPSARPQRIAFTSNAKPPSGVTVKLECLRPLSDATVSCKP